MGQRHIVGRGRASAGPNRVGRNVDGVVATAGSVGHRGVVWHVDSPYITGAAAAGRCVKRPDRFGFHARSRYRYNVMVVTIGLKKWSHGRRCTGVFQ
jgi:hypothetical protein